MKRAISFGTAALALATLAGCTPAPSGKAAKRQEEAATGWTRPPVIRRVARVASDLIVTGLAEPGARVVLRGASGDAHAAVADDRGRFEIRMEAPQGHLMLRPETQIGQDAAPSPDRLLLIDGGQGPVAVLRAGSATRRLDAAPALGSIDSDGRQRIASGRTTAGARTLQVASGDATMAVAPDAEGFWTLMLPPSGGRPIRIGSRAFDWPDESGAETDLSVERGAEGWSVRWSGTGGARQWTWLPDGSVR